ncbi:MAG TPA: hypothetical protein PKD55_25595, partial [Bellilinea sp.]|nr:hypothetical protein [Bellilinea sp.]
VSAVCFGGDWRARLDKQVAWVRICMKKTIFKYLLEIGVQQSGGDICPVDTCLGDSLIVSNFYG